MARPYDEPDVRMGWVGSFVATARCLDYTTVAREMGVSSSKVKRDVRSLEASLHKLLILDDGPLQLYEIDGAGFLPIAHEILDCLRECISSAAQNTGKAAVSMEKLGGIRVSEMKSFSAVIDHSNYDMAAYELGCSYGKVRDDVKKVQSAFSLRMVTGYRDLHINPVAHIISAEFKQVNKLIDSYRAAIPDNYKISSSRVKKTALRAAYRKLELERELVRIRQKPRLSKYDLTKMRDCRLAISRMTQLQFVLGEVYETTAPVAAVGAMIDPSKLVR